MWKWTACYTSFIITRWLLIDRTFPPFVNSCGCKGLCCSNLPIHTELVSAFTTGLMGVTIQRSMLPHYATMGLHFDAVMLWKMDTA